MPIVLARPPASRARLTHVATADSRAPVGRVRFTHPARATSVVRLRVQHLAHASSAVRRAVAHVARARSDLRRGRLSHLVTTSASLRARFEHSASATSGPQALPSLVRKGRRPHTTIITSSLGQVVSAQYSHTGTRETLTMTLVGRVEPVPFLDLQVTDLEGSQVQGSISLLLDGDVTQYEHRQSPTGGTTVLRAENRNAARLGSYRLPELIPWKLSPTPPPDRRVPCSARPKPQSTSVNGVVTQAFQLVGISLTFPLGDPFIGLTWKEGERDYSSLGKTPDQVFADTYGQLSYTYVMLSRNLAAALPAGASLRPQRVRPDQVSNDLLTRREAANTPSLLNVTGADLLMERPSLIELAALAPDRDRLIQEVARDHEWHYTHTTPNGETIKGFRKALGMITYTNELTLSDVTVQETVDGQLRVRTFGRVVTGYTSTESTYDPDCADAMIRQRTVKQSFGYGLSTETHGRIFSGPTWGGSYQVGDPLADEEQTVYKTFSPDGSLAYKNTVTRRLASLEQQGADGPLMERGPLQAREYLTQTLSEAFQATGGGKWLRIWSLSGDQQLPLYDQETGDAVRLASRGATLNSDQEVLDQAPEQVRCPDLCAGQKVAYPQMVHQSLPDGREGLEVSRNLPFVDSALALQGFTQTIAASLAATQSQEASLTTVQPWLPGVRLTDALNGVVEGYSLDAAAGMATVRVSLRELLPSGSVGTTPPEGAGPWRDMVLWRWPGGVYVNHLKEIKEGVPTFDRIFVRATGANLPNPGDEIEWRNDTRYGPTATGNYGT